MSYDADDVLRHIFETKNWRLRKRDGTRKHYPKNPNNVNWGSLSKDQFKDAEAYYDERNAKQGKTTWKQQIIISFKIPFNMKDEFKEDAKTYGIKVFWDNDNKTWNTSTWFKYITTGDDKPVKGEELDAGMYVAKLRASQQDGVFYKTYEKFAVSARRGVVKQS